MISETQWQSALQDWKYAIGAKHVVTDQARLAEVETTTFSTGQVVPAVLLPGSRAEVQECVRIATRYRVPVYPVSSGLNWGYGSSVPARTGCVVLNLIRMDRILDFDEKLAYVTVEPGVTQEQLYRFLQARKSGLWMDATGASPRSSLIGNTMERGFGHTPYGDHFAHVCGLEVVLPDGEYIETGYSRFGNAKAGPVYRWGVGPVVDGLFSQSNFGVVTRMSLWLMPAPECFRAFFFRCPNHECLGPVVESLSRLRLTGILQSAVHVGNDYKVLAGLQQYPWEDANGKTPLSPQALRTIRRRLQFGAWNGSGALYGTRAQVKEAERVVRRALKGSIDRISFIDDRRLELAARHTGLLRLFTRWDLSRTLAMLRPLYGLLKGVPTDQSLHSVYWRKRTPPPDDPNPDRDGCGLIWFAPIVPANAADVIAVSGATSSTLLECGFEPQISLTLINGRAIACVISISYDRDVPGEDERAFLCYRQLSQRINGMGYYSYRLGIQSMAEMNLSDNYRRILRTLKTALDPAGILAPGRYEPEEWRGAANSGLARNRKD